MVADDPGDVLSEALLVSNNILALFLSVGLRDDVDVAYYLIGT